MFVRGLNLTLNHFKRPSRGFPQGLGGMWLSNKNMKRSEPGEVFLSRRGWRRLLAVTSWGRDGCCCCSRSCRSHRRHKLAWVHLLHVVDSQPQTSATNKNKTLQLKHHHFAGTGGRFDAFWDLGQSYGQLFNFCHLTLYFYHKKCPGQVDVVLIPLKFGKGRL